MSEREGGGRTGVRERKDGEVEGMVKQGGIQK